MVEPNDPVIFHGRPSDNAVTLRDLFAACILIGTGWDRNAPGTWEGIAARCYAGADGMLHERDKPR